MENSPKHSKYYKELDLLRGFAIILVVIGHSFLVYPINIADVYWCSLLRKIIYSFHMPLFFAISGAVYKRKKYSILIKDKFFRLVIPYLFFVVLRIVAMQLGGELVNPDHNFSIQYYLTIIIKGGMSWFIVILFVIFVTFPIIEIVLNYNILLELLLSALFIVLVSLNLMPTKGFAFNLLQYYPYFIIGFVVYNIGINNYGSDKIKKIAISIISTCFVISQFCLIHYEIESKAFGVIVALFAIGFFWVIAKKIVSSNGDNDSPILVRLLYMTSRYSLQIYFLNAFLLAISRYIICRLFNITNSFIIVFGITIFCITVSIIICKVIVEKSKVLTILFGIKMREVTGREAEKSVSQ